MIGNKAPDIIVPWFVCTHCNNAGPLNECPTTPKLGPMCPRCNYFVQVFHPKHAMAEKAEWIMHRGVKYVPQRDVVQARSEVLAAVHKEIAEVEKMITDNRNLGSYDELVDRLANLKPAASDLKALLREAELKGVKSLPECWHYNQDSREDFMDAYFKQRQERIAELEKARAEGKG